jgi:hypothetical protein
VYVVQAPSYRDRETGEWVPKYDLSAAEEYGRLVYLLPPGNLPGRGEPLDTALARMRHRLSDYEDGDHLLALGDPVAMVAAAVVAASFNGGRVSLLKWDRLDQRYYPCEVIANNEG